jgi:transglutaminase-like putative cysteine protease
MKQLQIRHLTRYAYSEPVELVPHKLLIRPRAGHDIRIDSTSLAISPANSIKWHRDLYNNSLAIVSFSEKTSELSIVSEVILSHFEEAPLDFWVDDKAVQFPFQFDPSERVALIPYQTLCFPNDSVHLRDWLARFWRPGQTIETYVLLDNINKAIAKNFSYQMREEPGVQRPSETLLKTSGSCRDFATLFIEAVRYFGLAARFVSGYLHCPETVQGHGSTHAWSEVYLPGAGWKAFDSTSGLVVGQTHIATAVSRHPEDIPPVGGSFISQGSVRCTMHVEVEVTEITA